MCGLIHPISSHSQLRHLGLTPGPGSAYGIASLRFSRLSDFSVPHWRYCASEKLPVNVMVGEIVCIPFRSD